MIKKYASSFVISVLCIVGFCNSSAFAIELDEATRTVSLEPGKSTVVTPEQVKKGKRLFNASFYNIELLSNTEDAFIFDFMDESHFLPEKKTLEMPVQTEGKCYGIIQWIHLQMDDTITFENNPLNKTIVSGWSHVVYLFVTPLYVRANQVIKISAIHDRNAPWFALESVL